MKDVKILAGNIFANVEDRVITGLLIPYGEVGETNAGRFTVEAGAFTLPADPSAFNLNLDHERDQNVGRMTRVWEQLPEGIFASWAVAQGEEGDAALADAVSPTGKRKALSAEFNATIKAGKLLAGKLFGSALVERGAFRSAQVLAALAADTPDAPADAPTEPAPLTVPDDGNLTVTTDKLPTQITTQTTDAETATVIETVFQPVDETNTEGNQTVTATATSFGTRRIQTPARNVQTIDPTKSFAAVMAAIATVKSGKDHDGSAEKFLYASGTSQAAVFAVLSDIKFDGANTVGTAINQLPQWLGELYGGRAFVRKFAPLFGHGDLTAGTIDGWHWTTKPEGSDYAFNKAAVPSNAPVAAPYTVGTHGFGGAHDHDRRFVDFPNEGYWTSYWRAMTESYEKWADGHVLTDVLAAATDVVADNPAGLTIGAGMSALIDGVAEVIDADATPSFAVMSSAMYKAALKTPENAILGYLSAALHLEEGTLTGENFTILGSSKITAGHVLVGAKEAATVYELPGVPIRADAIDLVKGGVDTGLFGYEGTVIHLADALVDVAPYVAP